MAASSVFASTSGTAPCNLLGDLAGGRADQQRGARLGGQRLAQRV